MNCEELGGKAVRPVRGVQALAIGRGCWSFGGMEVRAQVSRYLASGMKGGGI